MPGACLGGGGIILELTFKLKYRNFHIILRNSKKYFFGQGEGSTFVLSLLLEIGLSNINITIFIAIK